MIRLCLHEAAPTDPTLPPFSGSRKVLLFYEHDAIIIFCKISAIAPGDPHISHLSQAKNLFFLPKNRRI